MSKDRHFGKYLSTLTNAKGCVDSPTFDSNIHLFIEKNTRGTYADLRIIFANDDHLKLSSQQKTSIEMYVTYYIVI